MESQGQTRLVLASQSPRRVELLGYMNFDFDCIPSHIDEELDETDPAKFVVQLAESKASEIAKRLAAEGLDRRTLVIGADTTVVLGTDILNKPTSRQDAYQMLMRMSGRCHTVFTGVAIIDVGANKLVRDYQTSDVYFRQLDPQEVSWYVKTEEPMDKAGSYALQGTAAAFVERIDGCYTNIIGLPMPLTVKMLRELGFQTMGMP